MKANRKSLSRTDDAVSPVIATILMVAITVVLGATVYVWVSSFGSTSKQAPTLAISKISTGANGYGVHHAKYQMSSISAANVPWTDLVVKVNGVDQAYGTDVLSGDCATGLTTSSNVAAGDQFCVVDTATLVGKTLSVAHKPTGSVLATVTV